MAHKDTLIIRWISITMTTTTFQKPDHFRRTIALLLLLVFGGIMVSDMYLPALPHLIDAFHTTSHHVQITISVYFAGACASILILGPLSDRIGRRTIVLLGMAVMMMGTFLCWYATHFSAFLVGRILQGLGAGGGFAVMRTVMRDMVRGNDLANILSYISIIIGVCPAIAPALGGMIVTHFSWRAIFLITLIYYICLFLLMSVWFLETLPKTTQLKNRGENVIKHAWAALSHSEFMGYCIASAAVYAGLMAYITASPIIIEVHLHFTALQFGWITLGFVLAGQLSKIYNRMYLKQKGYRFMLGVGMGLLGLGSLAMFICALFHAMTIYTLIIPMIIYTNGMGIFFPNLSTAALSVFTTIIGMASAFYGAIQLGGGMIGSAIIAHLSEASLLPLSACLMFFIAIAYAALWYAQRMEKINQAINQNMSQG
jgi:DHA1 family bicyclomycin/chloramphenicol resistance-like MFS transporter